jgi:hypothetical protein
MRKFLVLAAAAAILSAGLTLSAAEKADEEKKTISGAVKGNSEFAFDLYGQLRKKDGNLFLP